MKILKNYTNIFIYWNQMKISECTKYLEVWSAIKIAASVTVLLNYYNMKMKIFVF